MFIHNFIYSLKTLFKNKMLIFWTFAFPIILGTFFYMAFSNIQEGQKLNIINIAIVENEELKSSEYYKKAFDNLSDEKNEDRLFNVSYVNEEEAKEKLQNDEIAGYMKLEDGKPKLTFVSNGIDQTVFKYITEQITQTGDIITSLTEEKIKEEIQKGNYNFDSNEIVEKIYNESTKEDSKLDNITNGNLEFMMIEFYTLIAMTCLYGGMLGIFAINQNLANMSNKGKRIEVAPTKKGIVVLSSLLASYVAQAIGLAILFAYTILVLKINYGNDLGLIVLLSACRKFSWTFNWNSNWYNA